MVDLPPEDRVEFLHTSEDTFGDWVKYSAGDAYLTGLLYSFTRRELEKTEWRTRVVVEGVEDELVGDSSSSENRNMWEFYSQE